MRRKHGRVLYINNKGSGIVAMSQILFWYASHHGQTRKILEHMGRMVPQAQIEWCLLSEMPSRPLVEYDHVLLAAPIRYGYFPASLRQVVREHHAVLRQVQAGFVGVCLTARKPEKNRPETNLYMRKWLLRSPWQPSACAVFAGAVRYSRCTRWQRWMIRLIMWMTQGHTDVRADREYTDWMQVDAFARQFFQQSA